MKMAHHIVRFILPLFGLPLIAGSRETGAEPNGAMAATALDLDFIGTQAPSLSVEFSRIVERLQAYSPEAVRRHIANAKDLSREDLGGALRITVRTKDRAIQESFVFQGDRLVNSLWLGPDQSGFEWRYYDSGKPASYREYSKGKPHGLSLEFYPTGRLKNLCQWEHGWSVGRFRHWDERGVLTVDSPATGQKFGVIPGVSCQALVGSIVMTLERKAGRFESPSWTERNEALLLERRGESLPVLDAAILSTTGRVRARLVSLLARFPESEASDLLLEWACRAVPGGARRAALWALGERALERPLRPEEMAALGEALRSGDALESACAAHLLARGGGDANEVATLAVRRFREALGQEVAVESILELSLLPPRHTVLARFLEAFRVLGAAAGQTLGRGLSAEPGAVDSAAWETLAAVAAGDRSQSEAAREIVMQHRDPYLRAVAVPVYARVAGAEAMALLQGLRKDAFVSEYGRRLPDRPGYPIREAAERALAELGGK